MYTVGFPGCCTASIVTGFGQTDTADHRYIPGAVLTEQQMNEYLDMREKNASYTQAVLVIALNSDQKLADKVLRKRGYRYSRWMSKKQHSDKKLRIYYLELNK